MAINNVETRIRSYDDDQLRGVNAFLNWQILKIGLDVGAHVNPEGRLDNMSAIYRALSFEGTSNETPFLRQQFRRLEILDALGEKLDREEEKRGF